MKTFCIAILGEVILFPITIKKGSKILLLLRSHKYTKCNILAFHCILSYCFSVKCALNKMVEFEGGKGGDGSPNVPPGGAKSTFAPPPNVHEKFLKNRHFLLLI